MVSIDTQILKLNTHTADIHNPHIQTAADIIQAGGLVAFPTETVYGLGADALNTAAVRKIFEAKQRPAYDPIIVHVNNSADLETISSAPPDVAFRLAEQFWPGPLTLIVPKSDRVPSVITANGLTVAVRAPSHPVAQALIQAAGTPIGAPSANQFSHTSPTTAQHVWHDLAGRIELILDGGSTPIGVESTVIDLTSPRPRLLRPGGLKLELLREIVPDLDIHERQIDEKTAAANAPISPGMLDTHYAPRAEMVLFSGSDAAMRNAIQQTIEVEGQHNEPRSIGLLLATEDMADFSAIVAAGQIKAIEVGPIGQPEIVARELFAALRNLDTAGVNLILARDFPPQGLGLAVRDRMRRAARRIILLD